jgi:hypothetical protein
MLAFELCPRTLQDMQRDLLKLSDYCGLGDAVRGLGGDDVGYVDFAKIAFFLFGLQIRALYYLFFLIYGLTLLCALIERNRDRLGQVILLTVAGMIYVAEAAKVIENAQRDLNIAFMNELSAIFHELDIDTTDVLAAAGCDPNNFLAPRRLSDAPSSSARHAQCHRP